MKTSSTIDKKCQECDIDIKVRLYDHNREQGMFCSRKCAAIYNNQRRKLQTKICAIEMCGRTFKTKCNHAKFCSPTCKRHQNAKLSKQSREEGKYSYHLSQKIKTKFGSLPCFHCGWAEAICDVHHIKGRKDGGTDDYSNLTILCPNDHRLVHKGKIQSKSLKTLENYSQ